jgi:hypothetical protein
MTATVETLVAPKPIITITMLIHGQITVTTEISAMLMEINTVTVVARGQMIATETNLMAAPMRILVETAAVHLIMIIEET